MSQIFQFTSLFIILVCLSGIHSQSFWDNFKKNVDNLGRTITGTGCLLTVAGQITDCKEDYKDEYESRIKGVQTREDNIKAECCAFIKFKRCVTKVAEKECGDDGERIADQITKQVIRETISQDCVDYGPLVCITLIQVIMAAGAVILGLLFLSCLISCCCCGGSKRGRPI